MQHHNANVVKLAEKRWASYCSCGYHKPGFTTKRNAEDDADEHVRQLTHSEA